MGTRTARMFSVICGVISSVQVVYRASRDNWPAHAHRALSRLELLKGAVPVCLPARTLEKRLEQSHEWLLSGVI